MREDMDKVLVERPRRGGYGARKGRLPRDCEAMPRFLGLRRQVKESGDFKSLNENLAPLRRYLERQINRPWNKVYSEMRARIDAGNTVQAHVLTHVDQYIHRIVAKVEPNAATPCGLIYQWQSWSGRFSPVRVGDLYVDPNDGIIKRARRRVNAPRAARSRGEANPVRLDADHLAVEIAGVWYAIELAAYEMVRSMQASGAEAEQFSLPRAGRLHPEWADPLFGPVWPHDTQKLGRMRDLYGPGRLAIRKRQLAARELRRHGLVNHVS